MWAPGHGRLYCWGSDAAGQVGEGGGGADQQDPVEVAGGHTDWRQVSAGGGHTCGRRATGRLYCWGADADGQLGEGPGTADKHTPVPVTGGWTIANAPSAGDGHTCATRVGGRLYCWGRDDAGQLGEGAGAGDQQNPVAVNSAPTNWAAVSAGQNMTCGRRTTRRMFCWGDNSFNQLQVPLAVGSLDSPGQVVGNRTDWGAVSVGFGPCFLRTTGLFFCGTSSNLQQMSPDSDWEVLTTGLRHICGIRSSDRLYCQGQNPFGQIGDGTTNSPGVFVEVEA